MVSVADIQPHPQQHPLNPVDVIKALQAFGNASQVLGGLSGGTSAPGMFIPPPPTQGVSKIMPPKMPVMPVKGGAFGGMGFEPEGWRTGAYDETKVASAPYQAR